MDQDDDLIQAVGRLESTVQALAQEVAAGHKVLNGRIAGIETRLAELSGSVALVLARSEDNKKKSGGWGMRMPNFMA